jgi:hypothetical protein
MRHRRQFVKALLLGTVGAPLAMSEAAAAPSGKPTPAGRLGPPDPAASGAQPPPWELFDPLRAGGSLGFGWELAEVAPRRHRRIEVGLRHTSGEKARLHVYGRAGRPTGVAHTQLLDVRLVNSGHGDLPTDEGLAQAVAALSRVLAGNEARCAAALG